MSKQAFPNHYDKIPGDIGDSSREGMTLHEYYAGLIMASITNANNTPDEVNQNAKFSFEAAENLIYQFLKRQSDNAILKKIFDKDKI